MGAHRGNQIAEIQPSFALRWLQYKVHGLYRLRIIHLLDRDLVLRIGVHLDLLGSIIRSDSKTVIISDHSGCQDDTFSASVWVSANTSREGSVASDTF